MAWKNIPNYKVPKWVKRKKHNYVKGRTYLYRRRDRVWQKKLRNEWDDKTPWWMYILMTVIATIIASIVIKWWNL